MQFSEQSLCRTSWWSTSRTGMGGPDHRHRHVQHSRKDLGGCVGERDLSALDVANHGRAHASRFPKLRLCQPATNSEITQIGFLVRDDDKVAHGYTESGCNAGEYVDLRRRHASFPLVERRATDICKTRQVRLRYADLLPERLQTLSGEAAHHTAAHTDPTQTPMFRHAASDFSPMQPHVALPCWYSTYMTAKPVTTVRIDWGTS